MLAGVLSWPAAGLTVAVAGCGGGAFSVVPPDAGAAVDSSAVDSSAGGDTGAADAPGDTAAQAADAGPDGDAASSPDHWCAGQTALFCEDFDEQTNVTPFLATWTTDQTTGGTFAFDTSADVPSPPNALRVTGASGAQVVVLQSESLMAHPKTVRLTFALRVNSAGTVDLLAAAGFAVLSYGLKLSDGYVAMAIANGPSIAAVWTAPADAGASDAGPFQLTKSSSAFPTAMTWAGSYTLEIDFTGATAGGAAGCLQAYVGPTPLLASCMPLPPSLSNPSVLAVGIGDYAGGLGGTGDIDLEFDNLTLDVTY